MHTAKMFVRDDFGQLSAWAANVFGSCCSCGSLTAGEPVSRKAPGNQRRQRSCSLLRMMETNDIWVSDGIVLTLVMLTTNTFASIPACFWEDENHCALTDFCSCLFLNKGHTVWKYLLPQCSEKCNSMLKWKSWKEFEKQITECSEFSGYRNPLVGGGEENIQQAKLASSLVYIE